MSSDASFRWRPILASALLPSLLFATGEGAIIPVIPHLAAKLGSGLAGAGLIAAMLLVGTLVGDVPSGVVVSRIGERRAMTAAAGVAALGLTLCLLARAPFVLGLGILLVGIATATFALARQAFMTTHVPLSHRARAMSTLGGTFRLGYLVGPFIGAGVITLSGTPAAAFVVHLVGCLSAALVLLVLPDPGRIAASQGSSDAPAPVLSGPVLSGPARSGPVRSGPAPNVVRAVWEHRRVLSTLGVGSALIAALRGSRQVILPLWAVSIGLHESTASVIIGVAGAVDFALFYAGGQIMDRFGRLWTAVPSMVGLGAGHLLLALSGVLPGAMVSFIAIALFLALANGIGAGILMTLGADLADPGDPAPFLGAWRFCNDTGGAAAPLVISAVTAAASLPVAAAVLGGLGLIGALALRVFVPRYSTVR